MKSSQVLAAVCGALLCSLAVVEAGAPAACCNTTKPVVASNGNSNGNGTSGSQRSGRVFGVFQTRSRTDVRDSWYHTHPKWSAGRKATGAAYR
ncbi:MAG: hypothetical protein RLZZ232_1076 [Planctomycetota bacterium]|jgi:hypothetical protein